MAAIGFGCIRTAALYQDRGSFSLVCHLARGFHLDCAADLMEPVVYAHAHAHEPRGVVCGPQGERTRQVMVVFPRPWPSASACRLVKPSSFLLLVATTQTLARGRVLS